MRDRRSDVCRIVERGQVDEVAPVGQRPPELPGGLEREPRLSGSARTGERDEADVGAAEQPGDRGQLELTADERRQRRRKVALHRANTLLRRERRILAQDRRFQPPQLLARLDAEVLAERAPRLAIRVERLCLPAAAVEREHELAAEPLAVRVLGDQALQLGHEHVVCALVELCIDSALDGGEPKVVEPSRFRGRKRRVDSHERRPAPELERARRILLLVLEEAGEVELAGLDPQPVTVADRLDAVRAEQLPQAMDRDLERVLHARGRILAPERIDQRVAPDDLVCVQEQKGQERALAGTADRKQARRSRPRAGPAAGTRDSPCPRSSPP